MNQPDRRTLIVPQQLVEMGFDLDRAQHLDREDGLFSVSIFPGGEQSSAYACAVVHGEGLSEGTAIICKARKTLEETLEKLRSVSGIEALRELLTALGGG